MIRALPYSVPTDSILSMCRRIGRSSVSAVAWTGLVMFSAGVLVALLSVFWPQPAYMYGKLLEWALVL
jgi:hypothetical protein